MPDIDPELDAIVDARPRERSARYRFQSAAEMRDALEGYLLATRNSTRTEDIGRQIGSMFQKVRAEVQVQIQEHMAQVMASRETAPVSHGGVIDMPPIQRDAQRELPKLSGSASGSGVVPNSFSFPSNNTYVSGLQVDEERARHRRMVVLLASIVSLLAVVVVGLLFIGMRPILWPATPASPASSAGEGDQLASGGTKTAPSVSAPSEVATPPAPSGSVTSAPVASVVPSASASTTSGSGSGGTSTRRQGPAAAAEPGFLTLGTYPFTQVTEGGRSLGTTPLVKVPLSAGTHTLSLDNAEQGIKQTVQVTIKSGETTTKQFAYK